MNHRKSMSGRRSLRLLIYFILGMTHSLFAMDVTIQKAPMQIAFLGEGKVLAEVKEISVGSHVYNEIQSVRQNDESYEVTFPDGKVLTISPVRHGVRVYFNPEYGNEDVSITMNHLDGRFFGIYGRNANGTNPDITGLTVGVDMENPGGGEAWVGVYSSFFMNSRGYGSFFDTFYTGEYKLGVGGEIELMHRECGLIDWYLFYGPTGEKIHEGLFSVIGEPKKVPMWALGPTIWRNDNTGAAEVLNDADQYIDLQVPVTHWWVDRPYSEGFNRWSKMNFDGHFSDPSSWIAHLEDEGVAFSTWVSPAMFGDEPEAPLQLNVDDHAYIDLSHPPTYEWYVGNLAKQYAHGVKGHKIDRVDGEFPQDVAWHDGTPREARWTTYTYINAKATGDALENFHGEDHFLFARAAYNRCQPYLDAIWGGDVGPTLKDMGENLCNAMRTSYMGFPIWGTDGGGYFSDDIPDDQYIRWAQFCLYNGMFEYMIDNRLLWNKSKTVQDAVREVHDRRMELLPYIYSLANTSDRTGVLMQPLAYQYPEDSFTHPMWDQYFFGKDMLVAPIYEDDSTQRTIYLPAGRWVDHNDTSVVYDGNQTITYDAPQTVIPVLMRQNSIYPEGLIYAGNIKSWDKDFNQNRALNINAFPSDTEASASFLYVDYLDGDQEKVISLARDDEGLIKINFPAMTVGGTIKVRLEEQPGSIQINGVNVSIYDYDSTSKMLTVDYPAFQDIEFVVDTAPGTGMVFLEDGGEVVMEAENYNGLSMRSDPNAVNWRANASIAGYFGTGYVGTPESQGVERTWDKAAEVNYLVKFSKTGSYHVWLRRYASSNRSNSVFAGLNNVSTGEVDDEPETGSWVWKRLGSVTVSESGVQTFQLRLLETGYQVDRILLTANAKVPSGKGPEESAVYRNSFPGFTSSSPVNHVEIGDLYRYKPSVTDADDDPVTIDVTGKPDWLEWNGEVLSGTPGMNDHGLHKVVLTADDGLAVSAQRFTLAVSAPGNDAPVITSVPETRVVEYSAYNYTISASDPDLDPVTVGTENLPSWMRQVGNVLSGTPFPADVGIHPVTVTATDGSETIRQQFNVAVFAVPVSENLVKNESFEDGTSSWQFGDAELVTNNAQDRNASLMISKPSSGSTRQQVPLKVGKDYNISVWIDASEVTSGDVVFDTTDAYDAPGEGQFVVGRPNDGWTPYSGTFTATTTSMTIRMFSSASFSGKIYFDHVVVAEAGVANAAPIITSIPITVVEENARYHYQLLAADAEDDDLTFSSVKLPGWLSFDAETGILSGTPSSVGSYDVELSVSDDEDSRNHVFTIKVEADQ